MDPIVKASLDFIIGVGGIYQQTHHHVEEVSLEKDLHTKSIHKSNLLHEEEVNLDKQTYLLDLFVTLEQHFQQLNADLVGSTRESERDMFDQRNQQLQTIILASSVMFSALSTVIVQGVLSEDASESLVILYSVTSSLSFAFLFLSIVICIEVTMRSSIFMYNRSKQQSENLKESIRNANKVLKKIRNKSWMQDDDISPISTRDPDNHGNICVMEEGQVQGAWMKHEDIVHGIMDERRQIIEEAAKIYFDKDKDPFLKDINVNFSDSQRRASATSTQSGGSISNQNHGAMRSFDLFWETKCMFWSNLATLFFYGGAYMLLVAIMVFMWSAFLMMYTSLIAAIIAMIITGLSLIVGVVMGLQMRFSKPVVNSNAITTAN